MNKIAYALVVATAFSGLVASNASADGRNQRDYAAWRNTVTGNTALPAPALPRLVEGRNAAVSTSTIVGVEPYIARTIERNRRGS